MLAKRKMADEGGSSDGRWHPKGNAEVADVRKRMRRRRDRSEIIAAAAKVFQRKGYADATIEDIAVELGLLKGSLYHYARSKEELLYAVVEEPLTRMTARLEEIVKLKVPADRRIELFVRMHLESFLENYPNLYVYLQEKFDAEEPTSVIRRMRKRYQALVEKIIVEGIREGVFRSTLHPGYVAFALLGSLNWTHTWLRPGRGHTAGAIADAVIAMTLDGMAYPRAGAANNVRKKRDR